MTRASCRWLPRSWLQIERHRPLADLKAQSAPVSAVHGASHVAPSSFYGVSITRPVARPTATPLAPV
jgi:hypothetical protein